MCCAIFYLMVNTGQIAVEKTRVLNAADAAAYSAGVVQARGLNYAAYANRAIVANQVAIAQTLSMTNFLNHAASVYTATDGAGNGIRDLSQGLAWATPPDNVDPHARLSGLLVGSLIAQYYGYDPDEFVEYIDGINGVAAGFIQASNAASVMLDSSVVSVLGARAATLLERSQAIASRVASEMDPALQAVVNPVGGGVGPIVRRYSDDERARLQGVVLASLDDVVRQRGWTSYSVAARPLRVGLIRRGATWMPNLDSWASFDSLSYRSITRRRFGIPRFGETRIAGANATAGEDSDGSFYYRGDGSSNSSSGRDTDRHIDGFDAAYYSGMASAYDVDDPANREPTQHRAGLSVWVRKGKSDTNTAGHNPAFSPAGRLAVFSETPVVDQLSGIARAEVLFMRPPRPDGRNEYPNLFNPFWTVRLVSPSATDYAMYGAAAVLRYWN